MTKKILGDLILVLGGGLAIWLTPSCSLVKKPQPSVTLKTSDPNIIVHQKNMSMEDILHWADSIHQIEILRLVASRDSLLEVIRDMQNIQQEPYREHKHE